MKLSNFRCAELPTYSLKVVDGKYKNSCYVEEMNLMVEEVNEREVDSIDVLSNHVYQYKSRTGRDNILGLC